MELKKVLYKLFFFILVLITFSHVSVALSNKKQEKNNYVYQKKYSNIEFIQKKEKKFIFLKKNECFLFSKYNVFFKKTDLIISNSNFTGIFQKNKFKMFYVVKPKDTLYSIGKKSGHSYYELSRLNVIKKPYKIFVGQKIWVGDFFVDNYVDNCSVVELNKNNVTPCKFIFNNTLNLKNFLNNVKNTYDKKSIKICFSCNYNCNISNFPLKNNFFSNNWFWPVKSKHIQYVYDIKSRNQHIEIPGFKGQSVFAAADGEVVYITDLFEKYGRLIIIRHNENYLSIYAFNDVILVKPRDKVHAQQKISTMGFSDKNIVRLYFEIRYKGESVNPLKILPKIDKKILDFNF
ncbi:hypothetical protein ATN01_02080 [Buchnera aphidicola (Diuraphis noxia)]|uniref:LysM domain-containing protein n=1 Tax=Buchnera aphidicola subsp. Diuraphis noxia TaxID=118101 RepID=A0A1B2H8R6_BUCDN|nr:peptidoglycan DD-metalloendopeptidase family protein [Buchnera aphidicola]ANZ22617.1 hypothetical protein ATN01_02080 [Buchnera aphidicola (Diuraphis noxia)]